MFGVSTAKKLKTVLSADASRAVCTPMFPALLYVDAEQDDALLAIIRRMPIWASRFSFDGVTLISAPYSARHPQVHWCLLFIFFLGEPGPHPCLGRRPSASACSRPTVLPRISARESSLPDFAPDTVIHPPCRNQYRAHPRMHVCCRVYMASATFSNRWAPLHRSA